MSLFHKFANLILLCLLLTLLSIMFLIGTKSFVPDYCQFLITKSITGNNQQQFVNQYRPKDKKEFETSDANGLKNKYVNDSMQDISNGNLDMLSKNSAPINVLLLAYQRSGSSLLGEILSARPESMYIFEPLIEISNKRNIKEPSAVRNAMRGLFNCDRNTLDIVGKNRTAQIELLRKVGTGNVFEDSRKSCLETRIRVIKTIRLRMDVAKPLLEDTELNLKIIHLVRDPRGILNSLQFSDTWANTTKTGEYQCKHLRNDITLGSRLPPDRYIRVRYEDLIRNPLQVAVTLYNFVRIPLHTSLAFYLTTHTEAERFFKRLHQKPSYYSTYRKSTYDTKSWMKTMSESKRKRIESVCSDVMKTLGYFD